MDNLAPCPFCGTRAAVRTNYDEDMIKWIFVECFKCGARTRGKFVGDSADECSQLYAEVRDEWNRRRDHE